MDLQKSIDDLLAASPLPAGSKVEDLVAWLKKAAEMVALMPGAPAEGAPTPDDMSGMQDAMAEMAAHAKSFQGLMEDLDVAADKVAPTVAAMKAQAEGATDQEKTIAELRAFKADAEIRHLVDDHSDLIPPAKRDDVVAFAKKYGIPAAKDYVAAAFTTRIPTTTETPAPVTNSAPSPEFVAFRKSKGRTDEQIAAEWKKLYPSTNKEA